MMKRNKMYEEIRFKVAQEALSGIKAGFLARKYEVTPKTIHNWVKEYRAQFGDAILPSVEERISESKRLQELEERYAIAIKVLGEKELEIEILRDLAKKANPAYQIKSK
jgi:transposase-like protein